MPSGPDAARWQQLSAALDELLDLDPPARARRLAAIARDDAGFARELDALLQAGAGAGLLEAGVAAVAPALLEELATPRSPDALDPREDTLVGRWRVLRELGRGGMGEVLLAERADGEFAQQAALKRLKRGMDSEELLRRFAQERRILATLNHPHIARLLDGGIDAGGRPYFAMEYVEGEPITDYACRRGLGVRERLLLMQRVCEAVAYAQGRLVVHRDLKPSNIMVDQHGDPKLLDFGIAKLLADSGDEARTGTGIRVLSPAYAAPEQILGHTISTATDVYSLGVLLYELLTGQLPHRRDGALMSAPAEALARETAERPSVALKRESQDIAQRAWGRRADERERIAREIGGDLDRIVLTALRHEPERRYASAAALGADLRLYLDGRPIGARADTSGYRLRKFLRRHRVGAVATVLVLLSLVGGLGTALWQASVAQRNAQAAAIHARRAELETLRAEQQAQRAEQVKDFVVSLLQRANPEQARHGAQMTAVDLVREASVRVEKELAGAPGSQGELRVAIGTGLVALGRVDEGVPQVEAGVAQLREVAPGDPVLAKALHTLAMQYEIVGRLDEAQRTIDESLQRYEPLRGTQVGEIISARTTQAKLAGIRGDIPAMASTYRAILADRTALLGRDHPRLAVDWNNLAAVALRLDRFADAESAYAEAARLLALDPASSESRQAWLRAGRGVALTGLGDYARAEAELLAAIEIAERTLHDAHPIVAATCIALAALERHHQRWDAAARWSQRASAIYDGLNHPDLGIAELHTGLAHLGKGNDADALAVLTQAERHFGERRNREEPQYWNTQAALGLAELRRGVRAGAQRIDASLAALEQRGHAGGQIFADVLGYAAQAAERQGDRARLRALRQRELDTLQAVLGPQHPRTRAMAARFARDARTASR